MTLLPRIALLSLAVVLIAAGAGALVLRGDATAQNPTYPPRAVLPFIARDFEEAPLPPVDPSYCELPSNPASPPAREAVLGFLTVAGAPAPAGTVVQVFFDGKAGPAVRTSEAGGYRVLYDVASGSCSNRPGAAITVRVAGQTFSSGGAVGAQIALRFDITAP